MITDYKRLVDGFLSLSSGTYGPSHDPYAYQEVHLRREAHGVDLVMHLGLGTWIKKNGHTIHEGENGLFEKWESLSGLSYAHTMRALNHRRRMSAKERWQMSMMEAADAELMRYAL
jgi:hypothetical protein